MFLYEWSVCICYIFADVPMAMSSLNDEVKNWEPLSQEWVPSQPMFREEQLAQIRYGLSVPDNHLFLYGMKGLGKTMITRIVANEFAKQGKTISVPCGRTIRGAFKDWIPEDEKYNVWFAKLAKKEPLLIIFDDISSMFQKSAISSWLHDIHDEAVRQKTSFNLHMMVTSTLPLMVYLHKGYMADFTQSRVGFKTVTFTQYTPDQIRQILEQRTELALKHPDLVQDEALQFLATRVARLGSDMRFATRVLKGAISYAIRVDTPINKRAMQESYKYEWHDFYKSQYLSMPPHKAFLLHTVFWLLHANDGCASTEAYRTYTSACSKYKIKPMRERMLRIYLDELEDERFINLERSMTSKGRATQVSSTFDPAEMVAVAEGMDWSEILR